MDVFLRTCCRCPYPVNTGSHVPKSYFDFIHFRNVAQGITKWPQVLAEANRCALPHHQSQPSLCLPSAFQLHDTQRLHRAFRVRRCVHFPPRCSWR